MNKDVIYIEPEDDITDIITKIENSKSKIVALVPPKKAGVFRSAVNIKLISKVGATADKTVVLVTTDPSIIKLAAATKLPVTKNLQSAPAVPEVDTEASETVSEEVIEDDSEEPDEDDANEEEDDKEDKEESDAKDTPNTDDKSKKKPEKDDKKPAKKSSNRFVNWLREHKKVAIVGGICAVLLIVALVWALIFAPAATLTVEIRTTLNNFSENVSFTTKLEEENSNEGKFYLDAQKIESTEEVQFEATGSKNVGEKATGEVVVYTYFPITGNGGKVPVNAGTVFTISGLSYVSDKDVTISWDGDITALSKDCENYNQPSLKTSGCQVSSRIAVTAQAAGTKYNIAPSTSGWNTAANVGVYSDKAMTGGTDVMVTVVQQSDIDKAKDELTAANEAENKEKLYALVEGKDVIVIDSSFTQTTGEAISTPALGEEVKEGVKPSIKVTTTATIYVIDKVKVEEFITEKANLGENRKIYEMKDPFIENFLKTDTGYTGKLKTSYATGPKITENEVIAIAKGKGLGEAQHDLRDVEGVASVKIDTSFPWVTTVPGDPNKITVILDVKE